MLRAALTITALVSAILLSGRTDADRGKRWDAPYNPTAMQWLALSMQAQNGGANCPGQPPCVELTFAPAPASVALGILFPDDAGSQISWKRLDQMKQLALATANGMGYPAPEIFVGSVGEFLTKYKGKTSHGEPPPGR